jgi:NOL1/NOP2/fmu family ribosome biogenesis protein
MYFGRLKRNEKIQLSVEGSQIVGRLANKNIAIVDDENISRYMEGLDCKWDKLINCEVNNFVLIKNENDFFGSGILREDKIESLVPKARRIMKTMRKV